ncbi:hypothetical protein PRIPAC_78901 [Pristionchus pacificus]|uniref:Uncharacterized protein n=1 Tax=Pristionchus pacificus TaxID=54126 RepID=A0A2A6BX95_PRIPA|nr:hypothetical protein PRIPAC_78901 [Pristionchus pacificus]|eukprot:PDM70622.1 hypothetical protein PRIPAC_46868 [Pristionchus pacificus]
MWAGNELIANVTTEKCTSGICSYTNDTSRRICQDFVQPPIFYSLYPEIIFVDQSSRIEMHHTSNKPVLVPTSSLLASCRKYNGNPCEPQYYIEERSGNYTRNARLAVACYTHSDESTDTIFVCYGQACYVNHFNGTTTRGCFDYVFDVEWAYGNLQFQYLLEDRRTQKITFHKFLLLEYYLCSYDYCNFDNFSTKFAVFDKSNSSHCVQFLGVLIIGMCIFFKR